MKKLLENVETLNELVDKALKTTKNTNTDFNLLKINYNLLKQSNEEKNIINYLENLDDDSLYELTMFMYFGRSRIDGSIEPEVTYEQARKFEDIQKNREANIMSLYEKRGRLKQYFNEAINKL